MTFIEIIGYFGALFIGMVMGLTGSGGSILSVPILAYLFKYDEKTATAYSLFIVGVTAILGSIRVMRAKMVNVSLILYFGIPAIFGVLFSRRVLLPLMPDELFEVFGFVVSRRMFIFGLFAFLMLIAFYTMAFQSKTTIKKPYNGGIKFHPLIITEGFSLGLFMGLVGAGGGFLMVPALMLISKLPIKEAVGTSMVIVCMNSLIGFFGGDFFYMTIDWTFLLSFVSISFIGIIIGGNLSNYIDSTRLKQGFAYFVLCMAIFIFIMEFVVKQS